METYVKVIDSEGIYNLEGQQYGTVYQLEYCKKGDQGSMQYSPINHVSMLLCGYGSPYNDVWNQRSYKAPTNDPIYHDPNFAQQVVEDARFVRKVMAEKSAQAQQLLNEQREKREIQEMRNSNAIAIKRSGSVQNFKKSCKFGNTKIKIAI